MLGFLSDIMHYIIGLSLMALVGVLAATGVIPGNQAVTVSVATASLLIGGKLGSSIPK